MLPVQALCQAPVVVFRARKHVSADANVNTTATSRAIFSAARHSDNATQVRQPTYNAAQSSNSFWDCTITETQQVNIHDAPEYAVAYKACEAGKRRDRPELSGLSQPTSPKIWPTRLSVHHTRYNGQNNWDDGSYTRAETPWKNTRAFGITRRMSVLSSPIQASERQ